MHCQCKGLDVAVRQSCSVWMRSMQVTPGFRRDFDLDCVALMLCETFLPCEHYSTDVFEIRSHFQRVNEQNKV